MAKSSFAGCDGFHSCFGAGPGASSFFTSMEKMSIFFLSSVVGSTSPDTTMACGTLVSAIFEKV